LYSEQANKGRVDIRPRVSYMIQNMCPRRPAIQEGMVIEYTNSVV